MLDQKWRSRSLWLVPGILAIGLINFPSSVLGIGPDDSWRLALNWFFKHRYQAGTEWIYGYGPLGFLATTAYDPDLFFLRLGWEIFTKSLLAVALFLLVRSIAPVHVWRQLIVFLLAAIFFSVAHPDSHSYILLSALSFLFIEREESRSKFLLLFLCLIFSVYSLVKFTYLIFCVVAIVILEIQQRIRSPKSIVSPLLLYPLFFLFFWVATDQSLGNLPEYIVGSFHITAGYDEAMSLSGNNWEVVLGATIFFLLLTVSLIQSGPFRLPLLSAVVAWVCLFVNWKHGFVRQYSHAHLFFTYSLFCSLLAAARFNASSKRPQSIFSSLALLFCLIASIAGILQSHWMKFAVGSKPATVSDVIRAVSNRFALNVRSFLHPLELKAWCDQRTAVQREQYRLREFRSVVKDSSIDTVSLHQGTVLLNQWNWHPRPVFQTFFTFDSFLATQNATFFESDRAPEYVLFKLESMNRELPALDENQALFALLKRYQPAGVERSYLLLRRLDGTKFVDTQQKHLLTQNIQLGQDILLTGHPHRFLKLSLHMRESIAGRIQRFFFRPQLVTIQIRTPQAVRSYRFIPSMSRQGFLIHPNLQRTSDFLRIYGNKDPEPTQSFRLQLKGNRIPDYTSKVEMSLYGMEELTSIHLSDELSQQFSDALDTGKTFLNTSTN